MILGVTEVSNESIGLECNCDNKKVSRVGWDFDLEEYVYFCQCGDKLSENHYIKSKELEFIKKN
jgi:hypothetical protein